MNFFPYLYRLEAEPEAENVPKHQPIDSFASLSSFGDKEPGLVIQDETPKQDALQVCHNFNVFPTKPRRDYKKWMIF